jgi:hypothetical protein
MAKARRSISIKSRTYARLKSHCETRGSSVSGYLEDIIAEHLDKLGAPHVEPQPRRPKPEPEVYAEDIHPQHFSW